MKSRVGKRNLISWCLTNLIVVLMILSFLDVFSISAYDDSEELLQEDNEPMDVKTLFEPHGVKAEEPTWSPLSGSLPVVNDYYSIDFGDVNNDGKLDIVVGGGQNTESDGIFCWAGDGRGGWTEESTGLPTSGWRSDVELADLNNDGKLDIACHGQIYTGNGGEGGSMAWGLQTGPGNWNGVALGDVDNDGIIDIAAGRDSGVKVWTSNGGGGGFVWTDSSGGLPASGQFFGVYLGDVNNDGKLDIAAGSNQNQGVRIWTGNGESGPLALWTDAFTGTGLPLTGYYRQVCFGDANNDGKLDIAAATLSQGIKFWKGNGGEGGFTWIEESRGLATTADYYGVAFGDANNDGKLDIVAGNYSNGGIEVWLGDGGAGGSLDWTRGKEGLPGGSDIIDVCLGDVNNDGRLDIGATTFSDGVQVWAGNLPNLEITGWISASTGLPSSSGYYDVTFGDLNHDGKLDLAAASNSGLGVKVWLGDGTGIWTEVIGSGLSSTGDYNGVRLKDINHDGNLDVIASNNNANGMYVWLGDGNGGFGPDTGPGGATSLGGVDVGDINRDGDTDIASSYYIPGANPVYTWLGNGDGTWGPPITLPEEKGYNDVALCDVDHNGALDLFATSHMNGFRFWLGDGAGGWTLQPQNGLPITTSAPWIGGLGAEFGDVNHDGDPDIVVGGYNGNFGMRVYTSDGGDGGEVDWTNSSDGLPMEGQYAGVGLGDINQDGHLDILSANNVGTSLGIFAAFGNGGEGGTMVWTNSVLPDLPMSGNYWGAALGDINNDGVLDIAISSNGGGVQVYITQHGPTFNIDLLEGWNLISLALIQSNTQLGEVLRTINGDYKAVQWFDRGDAKDPWKHYNPQKPPELNDLRDLDHTQGIWIYVTKPGGTNLTVYGDDFTIGESITIRPGWNLVGYPSQSDRLRDIALNNTAGDIDYVYYFDAITDRYMVLSDSDYMKVGRGYYIHSTSQFDIVWEVPL